MPLVASIAPSGADILEGMAALHGWGRPRAMADCSGIVPVIVVLDGPAVSGPALLIGLADFVIMTEEAYAFVSGPSMVAEFTGVIDNGELGGATIHARHSGAATLVARDRAAADQAVADLLSFLPSHTDEEPLHGDDRPAGPLTPEVAGILPTTATGSYDVRDVIGVLVDDGHFVELRSRWAPNLVTALATVDGRPVGVLANQPLAIAGTLDIPASQKGARFVALRRAQPADPHLGRHARLLPGQGPRVARDDPPRRSSCSPTAGPPCPGCDPAQELRRCVHRHGLQAHGQRRLPGVARRRAGRDGRGSGVGHPPARRHGRAPGCVRGGLRRAPAQPVRRR